MKKWGGGGKVRGDGNVHFTIWRADEGKGERLSWDQGGDGRVKNAHHTDQNTGECSTRPKTWRTGEDMLAGGCLGLSVRRELSLTPPGGSRAPCRPLASALRLPSHPTRASPRGAREGRGGSPRSSHTSWIDLRGAGQYRFDELEVGSQLLFIACSAAMKPKVMAGPIVPPAPG